MSYTPLTYVGEFRLLTLLPGERGSQIQCLLEHADLESPPPCEALSYTWGNPKGPRSIHPYPSDVNLDRTCTVRLGNASASITYNLEAAFQQVRSESQPRKLWVHALCINQSNNEERSEQVKLMAKLYSQASLVLCSLGESDESTGPAFDTLEELCWAAKACIWQFIADILEVPMQQITLDMALALIDSPIPALNIIQNRHLFATYNGLKGRLPLKLLGGRSLPYRRTFLPIQISRS